MNSALFPTAAVTSSPRLERSCARRRRHAVLAPPTALAVARQLPAASRTRVPNPGHGLRRVRQTFGGPKLGHEVGAAGGVGLAAAVHTGHPAAGSPPLHHR